MATYKLRTDHFSLNNHHKYPPSLTNDRRNPQPSFALYEKQSLNEHKSIINDINMKNHALKTIYEKNKPNPSHPNYLTFCQQYTQMLFNKYNPQQLSEPIYPNRNQENYKPKNFNQQIQEKLSLNLIAYKRFFQTAQFEFEKDHEQLTMKIKYMSRMLYARNSAFAEKDQEVDEELLTMELFLNKINMKIIKESSKLPSYFVTPFTVFFQDVKKGRRTPERPQIEKSVKKHNNKSSLDYYEKKDFIKGDVDGQYSKEKQQKVRKFLVSPNSPQMLLQSFNQQYNNSKQKLNDIFVSFNQKLSLYGQYNRQGQETKPFQVNGNPKDLQNSQAIDDTLKYSKSDIMGNDLNIDLVNGSAEFQQSSIEQNEFSHQELPFSPVQPYRLHKLYNQTNIKKIHKNAHQNTHKTDQLQEPQLFIDKESQYLFNHVIKEIQGSIHILTQPIKSSGHNLTLALSQTQSDVAQIVAQSHVLISEEKLALSQDWEDVMKLISKDIAKLQEGLGFDKLENDMKDKKFLQNLEIVQNQLIEHIFQEKQFRKAQEKVLTQVLTNLVENLQNNYA